MFNVYIVGIGWDGMGWGVPHWNIEQNILNFDEGFFII